VPLASAIAWLAGLFFLFGWKINIYNIVTFAVLIGIGVDHGIHMVGRWVEDGGRSVRMAVRETGVAIASTSVTTAIGFGGMMVGGHRGLASLGSTAAAGIMLVFLAAMTTLPALLHLFGHRATARRESKS
jgi:predicted RND superfamily exporter protein